MCMRFLIKLFKRLNVVNNVKVRFVLDDNNTLGKWTVDARACTCVRVCVERTSQASTESEWVKREHQRKRALHRLQIRRAVSYSSESRLQHWRLNGKVLTKAAQSNSVLIKPISALKALSEWVPLWIKCAYTQQLSAFLNKHNQDFPTFRRLASTSHTIQPAPPLTTACTSPNLYCLVFYILIIRKLVFEVRKIFKRLLNISVVPFSFK